MTVRELIKILKSWPNKDTEVLMSVDAEGNDFRELDEVAEGLADDNGDILCHDEDEEDNSNHKVLIIYPV